MNTTTTYDTLRALVWIPEHGGLSHRAATTAGVYRAHRHSQGGWITTYETAGGVLRGLASDLSHVPRCEAERVPGLSEAQALAQAHADGRTATVVPLEREDIHHTYWPGDGVSWDVGSDRCAGTVARVSKTSVWVRRDRAVRTDDNGMSEDQSYRFVQLDHHEPTVRFTLRSDGQLRMVGRGKGSTLHHGRSAHRDPHF